MAFNNITPIKKPITPREEQEAINTLVDAINWAKPNAWFIRYSQAMYEVGDVVNCPYFRDLELRCIQAGTTSNDLLDKKALVLGSTIVDGSVRWVVQQKAAVDISVDDQTLVIETTQTQMVHQVFYDGGEAKDDIYEVTVDGGEAKV